MRSPYLEVDIKFKISKVGALAMDSPGARTVVFSAPEAIRDLAHERG